MDAILAASWLAGQILSLVALCVGLVLSVLYWGLRDAVPPFVPEQKDEEIEHDRRPDFKLDAPVGPPPAARIPPEQVRKELSRAGYQLVQEHGFLPNQYFLVFQSADK